MSWELIRYNWSELRAMSGASSVPNAFETLQAATDDDIARQAYWRIDNHVIVQGALYEAALPTTRCACHLLSECTQTSRVYMLELLVQLCTGEVDPSEISKGNEQLAKNCRAQLIYIVETLFQILETGHETERIHCVDLLGIVCCEVDRRLVSRTDFYFNQLLHLDAGAALQRHVSNWLKELHKTQRP
jgi:hypothetical protein